MAPFLLLLAQIRDDDHKILLKLHTKKSTHRIDGAVWRSELLSNLLDPELVSVTLNALRRPGPFGIVGPKGHIVSMRTYRGANIDRVRQYSHELGVASLNEDEDPFVAGSMFFARAASLTPLLNLGLSIDDFEPELGQVDGTLAHALERLTTYAASAAGYRVGEVGRYFETVSIGDPDTTDADYRFGVAGGQMT